MSGGPSDVVRGQRRAAANHSDFFRKLAEASGETPGQLLFPSLSDADAGSEIDRFLSKARAAGDTASCWSLLPTRPSDLAGRLLARGFQWGWQPHWMRLDLDGWGDDVATVPGIEIGPAGGPFEGVVGRLPNYSAEEAARVAELGADGGTWHLAAREGGRIVGHIVLNVCEVEKSGGIYSCGVLPKARRRGIGAALTMAACSLARARGCEDVLLNATAMGEPVYRRVGFQSLGFGQTWWFHNIRGKPPVDAASVAFVEAVGAGDVARMPGLAAARDLDAVLPCGVTAIEVGVFCGQPTSVEWLAAHGATLDVVSCWDIGWRERAASVLANHPERANLKRGEFGLTPLHIAVERDDEELARLVLRATPDLHLTDDQYHSTALGWAKHLDNARMVRLITGNDD